MTVLPYSGYSWDSYARLEADGLLAEVAPASWETDGQPLLDCVEVSYVAANLHFFAQLPHATQGEQLISQFFRIIPDRGWLFKFGRMHMSFIVSELVWNVRCVSERVQRAEFCSEFRLHRRIGCAADSRLHPVQRRSAI